MRKFIFFWLLTAQSHHKKPQLISRILRYLQGFITDLHWYRGPLTFEFYVNVLRLLFFIFFFQVVPFLWVLMSNRTTKSYKAIWKAVKELNPLFKPCSAMSDYEKALQNSLKKSFKGIHVYGCHFHFAQVQIKDLFNITIIIILLEYFLDFSKILNL